MLRIDFEPLIPNLATKILQYLEFAWNKQIICIICVNYYFFTITLLGSYEKCNSKMSIGFMCGDVKAVKGKLNPQKVT